MNLSLCLSFVRLIMNWSWAELIQAESELIHERLYSFIAPLDTICQGQANVASNKSREMQHDLLSAHSQVHIYGSKNHHNRNGFSYWPIKYE